MNDRLIAQADALEEETGGTFNFVKATEAGIIEFYTDGYEGVTKDTFTNDMLDSTSYEKRDLSRTDIVNAGDPVYKLVTDETWNIIIPLDDEKLEALADKSSVSIRFLKNNLETTAGIEIMRRDGLAYGVLTPVQLYGRFRGRPVCAGRAEAQPDRRPEDSCHGHHREAVLHDPGGLCDNRRR